MYLMCRLLLITGLLLDNSDVKKDIDAFLLIERFLVATELCVSDHFNSDLSVNTIIKMTRVYENTYQLYA